MPLDNSIPLQAKGFSLDESMKPLASMLSMQNSMQDLQNKQLAFQANSANLKELNAIRALANDPSVQNDDGSLNMDKFVAKAQTVAPTQGAAIAQRNLGNQSTQIANATNKFALDKSYMNTALETASGLLNDPRINPSDPSKYSDKDAANAIEEAHNQMISKGVPKTQALLAVAPYMNAVHQPGQVAQMLKNTIMGGMNPQAQAGVSQPNFADNGQQLQNTNPFAGNGAIQKQLPPTTPVMQGNTPGYLGPQPSSSPSASGIAPQSPKEFSNGGLDVSKLSPEERQILQKIDPEAYDKGVQAMQGKSGFVASGLPIGAGEGIANTQKTIGQHWESINQAAQTAPQDIGVLQNIISHAHGAATGIGADRAALIQAMAGKLGMDSAKLATTDTNLLLKNSAMLQLAGGDTNLAKTLAGAANPNNHMDEDAIKQAAYQVIGQKKMAIAAQQLFGPLKSLADSGSPEAYNAIKAKFDAAADPRIMQLPYMSDAEKAKMKQSMTPQEQKEFGNKIRALQSLKVVP